MHLLCPVDFSVASVDAARYAVALGNAAGGGEIELVHCVNVGRRAKFFADMRTTQIERADADMQILLEHLEPEEDLVISYKIYEKDPTGFIPAMAKQRDYDFIIVGTKGLNAVRDMTFGSMTETLFEQTTTPILAIPEGYMFNGLKRIVLAVDDEPIDSDELLEGLVALIKSQGSKLHLLHVRREGDSNLEYYPALDHYLQEIPYDYDSKYTKGGVSAVIDDFCQSKSVDLLCMIHRDRGWMLNVFHRSLVKEELYHISLPLLILHD